MGKLVIKSQGAADREVNLKLGDTKIGRKPGCDIILKDAGVSSEHAVIKTVGTKSVILDLDSTNGTYVEDQRVKQHELRNGETITIGKHSLIYRDIVDLNAPVFSPQAPKRAPPPTAQEPETAILPRFGQLLAVEGPNKGKRVALIKDVVTLDNPGKSPARISRSANGYVLTAAAGEGEPRLNEKPVPPGGQLLKNGDIIEVAGTRYQMYK
jgi:hypothetical protein